MNKKKLGVLVATVFMVTAVSIPAFAADGDIYNLTNLSIPAFTSAQTANFANQKTIGLNSQKYGYEVGRKVYKFDDLTKAFMKHSHNFAETKAALQTDITPVGDALQNNTLTGTITTDIFGNSVATITVTDVSQVTAVTKNGTALVSGTDYTASGTTLKVFAVKTDNVVVTMDGVAYTVTLNATLSTTATITKIADITATVNQNDSYSLPSTVQATMSDGTTQQVSVTWDKIVDTRQVGTFTFNGTVSEYSGNVVLTLTVNSPSVGNSIEKTLPPVIKQGGILIPVNAVIKSLGANLVWDSENQVVTITKKDTTIVINLINKTATVNGTEVALPTDVLDGTSGNDSKSNNGTFVLLDFIAQNLGIDLDKTEIEQIGDEALSDSVQTLDSKTVTTENTSTTNADGQTLIDNTTTIDTQN